MRRRLSRDGVLSVAVDEAGRAKVAGLGIPLEEDYDSFIAEAEADVAAALAKLKSADKADPAKRSEAARLAARRAAQRWSGKKPQVQVMFMEG